MYQAIHDLAGIPLSEWLDPCPLDPDWNKRDNPDGLELDWSYYTICNPPYD